MPKTDFKSVLTFAFLAAFFLFCNCETRAPNNPDGTPVVGRHVGQIAPDFTLAARDGSPMPLSSLRGKIVLINFWATWCPPCREEMPTMQRLYQSMRGRDFALLAVSIDEEGWTVIDPFVQSDKLTFPILWDQDAKVARKYGSFRLPETFILGRDGKILDKKVGAFNWASPEHLKYFTELTQSAAPKP